MHSWLRTFPLALLVLSALACGGASDEEAAESAPLPLDSLSAAEEAEFAVDPTRYPEMQDGRLDTVDMQTEVPTGPETVALWHVQAVNYAPDFIAMTYAFGHDGPDSLAAFAADGQPRLEDNLGNVYTGLVVPENPRLESAMGTMSVGVYLFQPTLVAGADSLTLYVNETTPPVIKVGPWAVESQARSGGIDVAPEN
jgi:hypothetical protein